MTTLLDAGDPRARVVTAPAGSGKTELLVRRHLGLLGETTIDRIVAISFTRRAAAELTTRLAQVLRAAAAGALDRDPRLQRFLDVAPEPARAADALLLLSTAPIGTVDAFVLALLREHALDAHLPLPDGGRAPLDGPVRIGGDPAACYRAAARAELERAGDAARVLLAEAELSEAEEDVASLAAAPLPSLWEPAAEGRAAILALAATAAPEDPTWPPAARARADAVRRALAELAVRARGAALREMAAAGLLGFDEALAAATALVEDPPPRLIERFDALLIDELQDTSAAQRRFYRAFAALPRPRGPIATLFVGDARQSIYRFRHADPHGWSALVEEMRARGELAELLVNRRATGRLVQAQASLFAALSGAGERGVDPLDAVVADTEAPPGDAAPIHWIDAPSHREADLVAPLITCFAARLRRGSGAAPAPGETAAVITRSWAMAARAARLLRDQGVAAQLSGDRTLLASRVATDLRLLLRALLDPADDVAAIGVLKLPSVGIPDAALGRTRLDDAHPALREARALIGREPTAHLLERLVAALQLRPLLAAGPEGDGGVAIAQLDALLELVREAERAETDPYAALDAITPSDDGREPPPLRLHAVDRCVEVTTVHAAKGLEWDHVAIVQLGDGGDPPRHHAKLLRLSTPRGRPSLGVQLDPDGGLDPRPDPVARRALAIADAERREEGARFLYVALTRARRSVTLAVPRGSFAGDSRADRLRAALANLPADLAERRPVESIVVPPRAPTRRRFTERVRPFQVRWVDAPHLTVVRPSTLPPASGAPAARFVRAPAAPPLPQEVQLDDAALGTLVHAYLERWAFRGDPPLDPDLPAPLAGWLVALARALVALPGLVELTAHDLRFEWPLIGAARDLVYVGRPDLVALLPDRRAILIDFKAGAPPADDGAAAAALARYAPQLDAYRRLLDAAGYPVIEVGLLFPRAPLWIRADRSAPISR